MTTAGTGVSRRSRAAGRWREAVARSAGAAVWPFVVSRAVVLVAYGLARFLVTDVKAKHSAVVAAHAGLLGWDANWYRRIAELGYGGAGRSSIRFFPLYPLAARALSKVPGISVDAALLIIANVAAFVALALLHRLVLIETSDDETASRAAWWLAMLPAAFVLSMGYADSLLLAASIAMFLALRTRHFLWAALAGVLAGGCRPVGLLLALPALIEAVRNLRFADVTQWLSRAAAVLSAPAGAAAYMGWSKVHDGSFFRPLSTQISSKNRGGIADPLRTIADDFRDLVHDQHLGTALHAPWVVFFVVMAVVLYRTWPVSYGAYATVTLAVTLTAPNLSSFERYALGCFPFALAVTSLTRRSGVFMTCLALSAAALLGYALLAFVGAYIP